MAISKEMVRSDHWQTATTTLIGITLVLSAQGEHAEAMEKFREFIPIYEKEYGRDSVKMAELLHHVAVTLENRGKSKEAMEKYKRHLVIQEKVFGINHATTIATRNNIEELQRYMQTQKEQSVHINVKSEEIGSVK
uniref:Kinesin light chain n=1 Tax=Chaetoceros debilis TaxID=122233 RepID=A0A7S3VDX5_9STRA